MDETHVIQGVTGAEMDPEPRQTTNQPVYIRVHCWTAAGALDVCVAEHVVRPMAEAMLAATKHK